MIHNLIVDYTKSTKINNIEHGGLEFVNTFTRKIKFYNPDVNEPMHKFWYLISNAKVVKNNTNMIKIALSSNDTSLMESIKNLDDKTCEIIKNINPNLNQHQQVDPSVITFNNFPSMFSVCIDADSKCYDSSNKHTNIKNIKVGSKIQVFVEFDSIIFGSTECSRRWRVLQLKEEQTIDMNINLFSVPQTSSFTQQFDHFNQIPSAPPMPPIPPMAPPYQSYQYPSHAQLSPHSQLPPHTHIPYYQNQSSQPPIQKPKEKPSGAQGYVFIAPTQSQLHDMLGKLKKTTKKYNNIDDKKNDDKIANDRNSLDAKEHIQNENFLKEQKSEDMVTDNQVNNNINPLLKSKIIKPLTLNSSGIELPETLAIKINDSKNTEKIILFTEKIGLLIDEQTKLLDNDNKIFDCDVLKFKNITNIIDVLIKHKKNQSNNKSESNSESTNTQTMKETKIFKQSGGSGIIATATKLSIQKSVQKPLSQKPLSQTQKPLSQKPLPQTQKPLSQKPLPQIQKPSIKIIKNNVPVSDDEFDPFEKSNE